MGYVKFLYELAGREERTMMIVGAVCALVAGLAIPANAVVLGRVINVVIYAGNNNYPEWVNVDLSKEVHRFTVYGAVVAACCFLSSYGAVALWAWSAARLGAKTRQRYFRALLSQSVGWFEINPLSELINRYEEDIPALVTGLGDKVPISIQWLTTWLLSYFVAFIHSWRLAMSILFLCPVFYVVNGYIKQGVLKMTLEEYQIFVTAGLAVQETLKKVNTIHSFHAFEFEKNRYSQCLQKRHHMQEFVKVMMMGVGSVFPGLINTFAFAVTFGYGNHLLETERLKAGDIFPVFFGLLFAMASVNQAFANMDAITAARSSIAAVEEVLEQKSPIDYFSDSGKQPVEGLKGSITFKGVFFRFPSRLDVKILNSLDLKINAGETVAVCGDKSSGIFAIPKLIERFYDVNKGQILIDNVDIRDYNLRWMRHQIGMVTRRAVLFKVSIIDNIRHGKADISFGQVVEAAKDARIHDFITALPNGYNTVISNKIKTCYGDSISESSHDRFLRRQVSGHAFSASVSESSMHRVHQARKQASSTRRKERKANLSPALLVMYAQDKSRGSSTMHLSTPLDTVSAGRTPQRPLGLNRRPSLSADYRSGEDPHIPSIRISADSGSSVVSGNPRRLQRGWSITMDRQNGPDRDTSRSRASLTGGSHVSPRHSIHTQGEHRLWKTIHAKDNLVELTNAQWTQVVIARALALRPVILLFEDVFSSLDSIVVCHLRKSLAARKQTNLIVTHSPTHALYADRIFMVSQGRKVDEGDAYHFLTELSKGPFLQLRKTEKVRSMEVLHAFVRRWREKGVSRGRWTMAKVVEQLMEQHRLKEEENIRLFSLRVNQSADVRQEGNRHPMLHLLRLQCDELFFISLGLTLSVIAGLAPISLAFIIGEIVAVWHEKVHDPENGAKRYDPTVLIIIAIAISVAVTLVRILLHWSFSISSSRLTAKLRAQMFEALLRQDILFFDKPENKPDLLAQSLTHNPVLLQGVVGVRAGAVLETLTTFVVSLILALLMEWRTALIISLFAPLSFLGSILQGKVHLLAEQSHHFYMERANEVFKEAIHNMTTIVTLSMKHLYLERLETILNKDRRESERYAHWHGLGHAFVDSIIFVCTALFFFSAKLIDYQQTQFGDIFMAFSFLVFGTADVDFTMPHKSMVQYSRAMAAAEQIFSLIDSPGMRTKDDGGIKLTPFYGLVAFLHVTFHYPNKPLKRALNDFNMILQPGATVALVGPHHCGKTTVLNLLQRLYDVDFGNVEVDGTQIRNLDSGWWQSQVCIVQDNPNFADSSIKDNITYGDPREEVPWTEVEAAAVKANLHDFIQTLPQGYDTMLENNGCNIFDMEHRILLSLARAAFRDPRILLVDSITRSLLPNKTRAVLESLQKVKAYRTCVIATAAIHEIIDADEIVLLSHGRVLERGNHLQLLEKNGCYAALLQKQDAVLKATVMALRKESARQALRRESQRFAQRRSTSHFTQSTRKLTPFVKRLPRSIHV